MATGHFGGAGKFSTDPAARATPDVPEAVRFLQRSAQENAGLQPAGETVRAAVSSASLLHTGTDVMQTSRQPIEFDSIAYATVDLATKKWWYKSELP